MPRAVIVATTMIVCGSLVAASGSQEPDAKALVAKLSDPEEKVRDEASAALKGRADALPWLRRAARSRVPITAARAAKLLAPHEKKRQEVVAKAIDACIRDGHADLFMEWHHYWKPENADDLWPVGPRAAKAALELFAKRCPPGQENLIEKRLAEIAGSGKARYYDGPFSHRRTDAGVWHVRTDDPYGGYPETAFASIAGPVQAGWLCGGLYFTLGSVEASITQSTVVVCDGEIGSAAVEKRSVSPGVTGNSVVICRGNFTGFSLVGGSVVLVEGDVDLSRVRKVTDCLIRASGEVHLHKTVKLVNCTIEAHAKNATAPYKFFELADVGLALADDEEGLVVTGAKADTPFGNCGIAKGDIILAIDDAPAGHSEEFRKAVRRALVRQGDCLVTVARGKKTLDLPVFFPLPK